jgi:MFS transporter, GlpU family, inner membrane protein
MMQGDEKIKRNRITLLTIILSGESIFFLPFVLARIFRPTLLSVFEITNLQLGVAFSVYGIVAMLSYFFGGPLADRFTARLLMALALWATAFGGLLMATLPSGQMLIGLYGYWGMTTIFLFWAAMIRATREWGGDDFQGRAFGYLEGGRGLAAALIGTVALVIFSWFVGGDGGTVIIDSDRKNSFQMVILTTTTVVFLIGWMVWFYLPKGSSEVAIQRKLPSTAKVLAIMKMPVVWMQGMIIVCAYVGYKSTDDYSLYANQVLGFDEIAAAGIGTAALWLRPVFAIIAGILVDRYRGSSVAIWSFILMAIGSFMIFSGIFEGFLPLAMVLLTSTLVGVYGIRGIYFALMQESAIPLAATGTAVGIMSVVGFTPDVFMSPLMGYLLDTFPGAPGHRYVFLVLFLFSICGLLVSLLFSQYTSRNRLATP